MAYNLELVAINKIMEQSQTDILTESVLQINTKRRKDLIPLWIKIFIWIFLIFGAVAPFALIFGVLGYNFSLVLYGFETYEPISVTGISIIILFLLKGITAYSLLKEKNWAITLGVIDAIAGIAICLSIMSYPFIVSDTGTNFNIRLELVLLIPYLLKLLNIKSDWEKSIMV